MGKKKDKKVVSKYDQPDDMSEISTDTLELAGGAEEVQNILEEQDEQEEPEDRSERDRSRISAAVDGLTEKRAKTRESSLHELKAILQLAHDSHEDSLSNFSETLDGAISSSLNRGGTEGASAADLLAVIFVVLGQSPYGNHIWLKSYRKLRSIGSQRDLENSKASDASACGLLAYAMGLLCCGGENDIDEVESALDLCTALAGGHLNIEGNLSGHVSSTVRIAALQSWALLASSVSIDSAARRSSLLLPHISSILAAETGTDFDTDLRNEGGQIAALICEIHANARLEAQENGEEYFGSGGDGELWETVRSSLHRLANESTKRMSKSTKKEQHARFRRVLRSVDEYLSEGVSELDKLTPNATVVFNGGQVTCSTWGEYLKLANLRRCLSGGLGDHMALGDVAASLMSDSLSLDEGEGDVSGGKRGKSSAAGREATELRGRQRSNKQQIKDSFFYEDS
mmetsp:Transcript_33827/g.39769  ORF Transcript_33827/g.39769 Transcript_33827/m.39769 type:complete len:458 (-) Transcript_33827:216-1589(-)|eukprot:CAMPEP_0114379524 /NCGR_PEP_ID=MMETSP0102-20121206/2286_1 /TAXON_ID=38822 ORGANISM="Pteridomonas danica, Strain PT" /NCGR_SAMPLE_ID=MMETSP0102 /ASSEMBLY_ACC=CAM_ASM_000212 /LENGTH=457 /DNA_ID=CAMNT_0001534593 /DNA_START=33 /DNA_END=1406 /DNA_ORIENTATION=-